MPGMVECQTLVPDLRVDMRYATQRRTSSARVVTATRRRAAICCARRPKRWQRVQADPARLSACGLQRVRLLSPGARGAALRALGAATWTTSAPSRTTTRTCDKHGAARRLHLADNRGTAAARRSTSRSLRCDAAASECQPLDMGTPFDFLDTRANTDTPGITAASSAPTVSGCDQRWKAGRIPQLSDGVVALHAGSGAVAGRRLRRAGALSEHHFGDTAPRSRARCDTARGRCDWSARRPSGAAADSARSRCGSRPSRRSATASRR